MKIMEKTLVNYSKIALHVFFWILIAYLLPLNSGANAVLFLLIMLSFYATAFCTRRFVAERIHRKVIVYAFSLAMSLLICFLCVLFLPEYSFDNVFFLFFLVVSFSTISTCHRWLVDKNVEQNENEQHQTEIELKHLRSQLHPHFLFNTLNNIYALCEIDSKRAQQSVHYLSQLLRYILSGERSGEDNRMVPVQKEHDFIKTYLQLIYLRMRPNVHVIYNSDITEYSDAPVLTLIFTSLIENAFKHGVASGKECVIEFGLTAKSPTEIHFFTSNPYFKNHESNNPESGIGLENLKRRLDIVYKNDYKLEFTNDGQTYRVDLTLKFTNNNYYYNA